MDMLGSHPGREELLLSNRTRKGILVPGSSINSVSSAHACGLTPGALCVSHWDILSVGQGFCAPMGPQCFEWYLVPGESQVTGRLHQRRRMHDSLSLN